MRIIELSAALSLAVLAGCSSAPRCTTSTCGGCCDEHDNCQAGSEAALCGAGGKLCVVCPGTQVCRSGTCGAAAVCGPSTCSGCCDASGVCQAGSTVTACGKGGASCEACSGTETCGSSGSCRAKCSAANCLGCCDALGFCQLGNEAVACGVAGQSCVVCGAGETCLASRCNALDSCADAGTMTTAQLQTSLISTTCAPSCHSTSTDVGFAYADFSSAAKTQLLVNKVSLYAGGPGTLKVVDPGHLANSTMWLKVSSSGSAGRRGPMNEATGAREPNGLPPLNAVELQRIKDWICSGANP